MYTTIPIILLVMQAVEFLPFFWDQRSHLLYYLWCFVQCTETIVCSIQTRQYDIRSSTDMDRIHLGVIPSKITREDMPYSAQSMSLTNLTQKKQML